MGAAKPIDAGHGPTDAGARRAGGIGAAFARDVISDFLRNCIDLFKNSKLRRQPKFPAWAKLMPRIETRLWGLYTSNKIHFRPLDGLLGHYDPASDAISLDSGTIKPELEGCLAVGSSILVHEGVHALKLPHERLFLELAARAVQLYYMEEIVQNGIRYVHDGKPKDIQVDKFANFPFEGYVASVEWLNKQQLIDYILGKLDYGDLLTKTFIRENLNKWGGLKNRWGTTHALYILKLLPLEERDRAIFVNILENIRAKESVAIKRTLANRIKELQSEIKHLQTTPPFSGRVNKVLRVIPCLVPLK